MKLRKGETFEVWVRLCQAEMAGQGILSLGKSKERVCKQRVDLIFGE